MKLASRIVLVLALLGLGSTGVGCSADDIMGAIIEGAIDSAFDDYSDDRKERRYIREGWSPAKAKRRVQWERFEQFYRGS